MIWLRSGLFTLFFYAATLLLLMPATVIRLIRPARSLEMAMFWARVILRALRAICGIRVAVMGREYLPEQGPALIASAHQSAFDTLVWLTLVPRACYVLKKELERIPLFGPLLRLSGMIPIDRSAGAASIRTLLREGRRAAAEARQIVIFPQGTRADPGAPLELQPGVAALAAGLDLPVIPVATNSGCHWRRRAFRKQPGLIYIRVMPPIPPDLPRRLLMQRLRAALQADPATAP
ncbi:MAG: 1-acyl-sn-glycerol-3-phosphate acyltransferase [Acetobacteraceae bacterium]|nr:1-acyl-sn-glycerol-3-phosphate acyltransferase [Acetobacteraceae bacterium]MBV8521809.1 1-acyl-sn-glycerol-3-phosphate acyltransferase [Acetobacteraceae bacterium]MBV8590092.1 1-acyl-sn-glycerol-3-phosphate acyltransferase [Acetobacteraceae bacterium]